MVLVCSLNCRCCFFFVKQKTAYEMRISDWSSDVCSSDLSDILKRGEFRVAVQTSGPLMSFMDKSGKRTGLAVELARRMADDLGVKLVLQIGRASCRERVCQYV